LVLRWQKDAWAPGRLGFGRWKMKMGCWKRAKMAARTWIDRQMLLGAAKRGGGIERF